MISIMLVLASRLDADIPTPIKKINQFTCRLTVYLLSVPFKTDSCVVEGACYAAGEGPRGDACSLCDPSHSINQFKHEKSKIWNCD